MLKVRTSSGLGMLGCVFLLLGVSVTGSSIGFSYQLRAYDSLGLYCDNGKQNGNYYIIIGYILVLYWGYVIVIMPEYLRTAEKVLLG